MVRRLLLISVIFLISSCGSGQNVNTFNTRALEENKAIEIIAKVLADRGYEATSDQLVSFSNDTQIICDIRVKNEAMSIEYITAQDESEMGAVPPASTGSRLYVLPATAKLVKEGEGASSESLYVLLLDEKQYQYHYNPTSDHRADVTYHEVESRLTRDLNDFISWYESKPR
ncbi:MAG: hypothetical protein JXX29_22120 [Deltaproteobacteria bacterium]|nr:hypothetical protein [Deltaproteobacteria bacterium]MBN2674393.1 hypothetical protein [Deltaproteobacteria bacterium]